jgi:hypothetical protein
MSQRNGDSSTNAVVHPRSHVRYNPLEHAEKERKGGPILVEDTKIVGAGEPVHTITAQCLKEMGIVPPILRVEFIHE